MIWRTRRGARELDGLLMAYASERAAGWGDQQIANFEHLLAQPDPVLLDWFMRRTQPGDEELKLLVDEIWHQKPVLPVSRKKSILGCRTQHRVLPLPRNGGRKVLSEMEPPAFAPLGGTTDD